MKKVLLRKANEPNKNVKKNVEKKPAKKLIMALIKIFVRIVLLRNNDDGKWIKSTTPMASALN